MANAVVTIIIVAVLLAGVTLVADSSLKSVNGLSDAWQKMEARSGEMARSGLTVEDVSPPAYTVDVVLENSGQVSLLQFESWDIIVEYYSDSGTYYQKRIPYTSTNPLLINQWTVEGIYTDALCQNVEVIQPGLLDPGEYIQVQVRLSPAAKNNNKNRLVIATSQGVLTSMNF